MDLIVLDGLRSKKLLVGLTLVAMTGGVSVAAAASSSPATVPAPAYALEAAAPVVAPVPAPVAPSAAALVSPAPPAESSVSPAPAPSSAAPAAEPGGTFVGPDSTSGQGPVVNSKSKPMTDTYTPPAEKAPAAQTILPSGTMYQRVAPGEGLSSFQPVTSLPSDAAVVEIIHAVFPQAEWRRAELIAGCESGMRAVSSKVNRNGSKDHGIFQLNDGGTLQGIRRSMGETSNGLQEDIQRALDPQWNVQAAHVLWTQRGWQPWTCASKTGVTDGLYSSNPGPNG